MAAKLGLLASLYLSQGLPFGFFTQALPVLMRNRGYSLEAIGLTTLLALPWALKFLWAPLLDRTGSERMGRRRSWILPLQAATVLLLLLVAIAPPEETLTLLLVAILAINLLAATQDIATDGLAIDVLSRSQRGMANGIQVAGYRLGMITGGGLLLILHERIGWGLTFGGMAAILAVASIPILRFREPAPTAVPREAARPGVMSFLRRPGVGRILGVIVVYKLGDAFATGMLRPLLVDRGLSLSDIGWLLGTVGFVAGLVGALLGGALVNRLGRRRALVGFAALQAATVGGYVLVAAGGVGLGMIYTLCAAEHLAGGMATAALFTWMMDGCRRECAATDYTVQASGVVIATGVASALSGFSAGLLGYTGHFLLATVLAAISVFLVLRLFPPESSHPAVAPSMLEAGSCG